MHFESMHAVHFINPTETNAELLQHYPPTLHVEVQLQITVNPYRRTMIADRSVEFEVEISTCLILSL